MPLQNRVTPFGQIITTAARGSWLGNRGVIHNAQQQIIRPFKIKAWIICMLHFRGRHREVMQPNRWTELFFLDEATAFSAGHRPCFQCRYADHNRFKDAWIAGNPEYGFNHKTPIKLIDEILHIERTGPKKREILKIAVQELPDGTFIAIDKEPYLIKSKELYHWALVGYQHKPNLILPEKLTVLTPLTVTNAFKAGYEPQMGV